MTGQYVKCDGCGAVVDRWPKEIDPNDGSFGKLGGGNARSYARSIGWQCSGFDDWYGNDYCPECVKLGKAR